MNKLSFFTPVQYDRQEINTKHKIFEGIEDYFTLGGRKASVIPNRIVNGSQEVELTYRPDGKRKKLFLGAIKVISYITVIIPFIMLVAKALFRTTHKFHTVPREIDSNVRENAENPLVQSESSSVSREEVATSSASNEPSLNSSRMERKSFQETLHSFLKAERELSLDDLQNSFPEIFPLLKTIIEKIQCLEEFKLYSQLINALYVLAGIKPVLVIEKGSNDETRIIIKNLFERFPSLKLINPKKEHHYLINENPLPEFDPRRFIEGFNEKYNSLEKAVGYAFPNQNEPDTDRLLSYLLGFGPSWEEYAGITKRKYLDKTSDTSFFSEEHYFQLGQVISQRENNTNVSRAKIIELGKRFSANIPSSTFPKLMDANNSAECKEIDKLFMGQTTGKVSYQTNYIQTGMRYRRRLLQLFELPERE